MAETERIWKTGVIEKFGDVRSVEERLTPRHLPPVMRHTQTEPTSEIVMRREIDERFRIKRSE